MARVLPPDTLFDVEISTPAGTLVSLKGVDESTARRATENAGTIFPDDTFLHECIRQALSSFGFTGQSGRGYRVYVSAYLPVVQTQETFLCPRRDEVSGVFKLPESDHWEMRGKDKCCSYCGSMHPDRVLELVREHGPSVIERSDKGYKWYIRQNDVPNAMFGGLKYYRMHDTPEFLAELQALLTPQA